MVKTIKTYKQVPERPEVPKYLVRDVIEGVAFYYKGYREVLNGAKTIEEIMPYSTLQSLIINYLLKQLILGLDEDEFHVFGGETGLHLAKKVNYGLDLAVFDTASLPFHAIDEHYAATPPRLVVEVDVKVEAPEITEEDFIEKKTRSLLDHGVQKVVWVTSKNKKVLIAEKDKDWTAQSWHEEFDLMPGITANVGAYLRKKGIPAGN